MHKYTVEFRVEGQSLVPSEITAILGLEPSQMRVETIGGNGKKGRKALWAFDGNCSSEKSKQEWESLETGLFFLLEKLLPKRELIWTTLSEFDMYWWCGHFQQSFDGGPTLSPELLRKLADFGAPLILDNYFSGEMH